MINFHYFKAGQISQVHLGLGPAILRALPKLTLGRALSHHKQEAGCIQLYMYTMRELGMQLSTFAITLPT